MQIRTILGAAAVSLILGTAANAAILIYDDAYANGWSKSQWDMTVNTSVTHNGSANALSARTASGGSTKVGVQNAGIMIGNNTLLEFWMNSSDAAQTGGITILLNWGGAINPPFQLDTRNYPNRQYSVDGTMTPIASVKTDADGTTWQKVRVDLTEVIYTGWPYVANQFNPATTTLSYLGISSGTSNLVVDDIQLVAVPEPAAFAICGGAGLLALRRRRA